MSSASPDEAACCFVSRLAKSIANAERHFVHVPENLVMSRSVSRVRDLQCAEKLRADRIVVGTHNVTGIKRIAFGASPPRVGREAKCPVMVVQPKSYAARELPEIEPATGGPNT